MGLDQSIHKYLLARPFSNVHNGAQVKTGKYHFQTTQHSAVEVEGDEVVQLVSRKSEIKVIVSQEYFLQLLSAYNSLLANTGQREERVIEVGLRERMGEFENKFIEFAKLVKKDEENEKGFEWQRGGQKKAGS